MSDVLRMMAGRGAERRGKSLEEAVAERRGGYDAGVAVTVASVGGIPAVGAAVRRAAEAVAVLDLGLWRGPRATAERVTRGRRARLFADEPNEQQTWFVWKETVEESLTFRSNAFIWLNRVPGGRDVWEWYALHPDCVHVRWGATGLRYHVAVAADTVDPVGRGPAFYDVGPETVLHIKGHGGGIVAPSPVERYRSALGVGVAKLAHEAGVFRRGAPLRLAVTFPPEATVDAVSRWQEVWRETYEGPSGHRTAALGGGATLQQIGMTQADAQFIESQNFTVAEVARMFSVPASLLDGGASGKGADSKPLTPEHEQDRWFRYGLQPRLRRIEDAINHALFAGSSVYAMFDAASVHRGDLATMADIAIRKVQAGIWLPDDARALDGLPPLPNGVGQIPQVTPVGGAANAAPIPATESED